MMITAIAFFALLVAFKAFLSFLYPSKVEMCQGCREYAAEIAYLQRDRSKLRRARNCWCEYGPQQAEGWLLGRIWAFLLEKVNPFKSSTEEETLKREKKLEKRTEKTFGNE